MARTIRGQVRGDKEIVLAFGSLPTKLARKLEDTI